MKAYFSTPEWVQKDLLLREGWPMQLMGTAAQNCTADPCDTFSLQLGLLDQKRVNKPLFFGGDGEIHGDFKETEFSPHKCFRGYNRILHVSFFHTKTLKPDYSWEASSSYIRLFLNCKLQILLLTPDSISFFG